VIVDLAMADGDNLARRVLSPRVGKKKALSALLCFLDVAILLILLSSILSAWLDT